MNAQTRAKNAPLSYPEIPDNSKSVSAAIIDAISRYGDARADGGDSGAALAEVITAIRAKNAPAPDSVPLADYQQLSDLCTRQGIALMEQEEWQKEAARYRWLRDKGEPAYFVRVPYDLWDETIDAAIAAQAQGETK